MDVFDPGEPRELVPTELIALAVVARENALFQSAPVETAAERMDGCCVARGFNCQLRPRTLIRVHRCSLARCPLLDRSIVDSDGILAFGRTGYCWFDGGPRREVVVPLSARRRRELLVQRFLVPDATARYRFTSSVVFETASEAAAQVTGTAINGWKAWRRPDGTALSGLG